MPGDFSDEIRKLKGDLEDLRQDKDRKHKELTASEEDIRQATRKKELLEDEIEEMMNEEKRLENEIERIEIERSM